MSGVKVAVRVRPFNAREQALNAVCCIKMNGPATTIFDVDNSDAEKTFAFDYSYWSHDQFVEEENGFVKADGPSSPYADQLSLFNQLGLEVLNNAWDGYHCCLFAYGQTGAGKSYSMVGYGTNKGIVPVSCEEIFRRIEKNDDENKKYEVCVGMLEIYNEQVQDLLMPPGKRPKGGLDVRESQQLGVYVQDLSKRPVDSYDAIQKVTDEGTSNRTVGATLMNATSSRAHTVVIIEFVQVTSFAGKTGRKLSVINLVDLAGSEKAGQTGASGDRLKEGCAINKSLSALGNVISALADKANGKLKKGQVVPYRDSKLTRLLQNALGGSSKTIMICALSPASSNYEETLSTLRYADRAKKIKNNALVNEDPVEKVIRELKAENSKLKALLEGQGIRGDGPMSDQEKEQIKEDHERQIKEMEGALAEMQKSWADKLKEAQAAAEKAPVAATDCSDSIHITMLNEDVMLSGKLNFGISESPKLIRAGKPNQDPPNDIMMSGSGVASKHCNLSLKGEAVLLMTETGGENTFVNGKRIKVGAATNMRHGDRLVLGQNYVFLVVFPKVAPRNTVMQEHTYESVMQELAAEQGDLSMGKKSEAELAAEKKQKEEFEQKMREAESARKKAEEDAAAALKKKEEEFEQKMKEAQKKASAEERMKMQEEFEKQKAEADKAAKAAMEKLQKEKEEIQKTERERQRKEVDAKLLDEKLMKVLPMVKEGNLIAKELKKPFVLTPKLSVNVGGNSRKKTDLQIAVTYKGSLVYTWHPDILENRIYIMREVFEKWNECQVDGRGQEYLDSLGEDGDPFWDPVQVERLIGKAQLYLTSLTCQLDNEATAKLLGPEGQGCGQLKIGVYPVSKTGGEIPDEECVEDAEQLIGTRMDFVVKVKEAMGLPANLAHDVKVRYSTNLYDEVEEVPCVKGHCVNPKFNYSKHFTQECVTASFLNYLKTGAISFEVYGDDPSALTIHEQRTGNSASAEKSGKQKNQSAKVPVVMPRAEKRDDPSANPELVPNHESTDQRCCILQ